VQRVLKVLPHRVELEPRVKPEPQVILATPAQRDPWDIVVHKAYVVTLVTLAIRAEPAKRAELVEPEQPVIPVTRDKPAEQDKLEEQDIEEQPVRLATPATPGQHEPDPPVPLV
jgi:hypothetical protein